MEAEAEPISDPSEPSVDLATFDLHVDHKEQASPSLFFTWCLSPEALEYLRTKGIAHPLLAVALQTPNDRSDNGEILTWQDKPSLGAQRLLFPLQTGAAYLQFRRPGTYLLTANVIWGDKDYSGSTRAAINNRGGMILKRFSCDDDNYDHSLPGCGLGPNPHSWREYRLAHTVELRLEVDKRLFAELPRWLTWWCNLMLPNMRDSCAWRRRLLFVFTIQSLLVLLWIVFQAVVRTVILLALLLVGARWRGLSLAPIVRPFAMDLSQLVADKERAFGWTERLAFLPGLVCIPLAWIAASAVGYGLWHVPWKELFISFTSLRWATVGYTFLAMMLLMLCFLFFPRKQTRKIWTEQREQERRRTLKEAQERFYATKIAPLVCTPKAEPTPLPRGLARVPESHRTVWVRFAAAKAELCKPFAH